MAPQATLAFKTCLVCSGHWRLLPMVMNNAVQPETASGSSFVNYISMSRTGSCGAGEQHMLLKDTCICEHALHCHSHKQIISTVTSCIVSIV